MTESVSLVADLHTVRCGGCKVLVDDPLAVKCAFCGATFDRVVSNHVGLAKRLMSQRAGGDGGDEQEAEAGDAAATAAAPTTRDITTERISAPRSLFMARSGCR